MKKYLVVFGVILGMALVSVPLFAQEADEAEPEAAAPKTAALQAEKANAVTIDLGPTFKGIIASDSDMDTAIFGIGVSYERLINSHFTFGLRMDLYTGTVGDPQLEDLKVDVPSIMYFGMNAQGRVYPLSENMDKLFIEAGLGFNTLSVTLDKDLKDYVSEDDYEFSGLTFEGKIGYKQFFGGRFFAEPSLGYVLAKSNPQGTFTPLGWQLGLGVGVAF
jgi:hypothetical protein